MMYLVMAYRGGRLNDHQYPVYCGESLEAATQSAERESADRGGKYGCAVYQYDETGSFKRIQYVGSSLHNENEPFHNVQADYFHHLGYVLDAYARGLSFEPCAEGEEFLELKEAQPLPAALQAEVTRQATLRDTLRQSLDGPRMHESFHFSKVLGEALLPCPFCGSTDLTLRTHPTSDSGYITQIVCNAGGPEHWHRCAAGQSITRDSYEESRKAGIKAWNTRYSPLYSFQDNVG